MARGLLSIVIGGVLVFGGLSGGMVLRGTGSSGALAVVGGIVVAIGLFRVVQANKQQQGPPPGQ